MLEQREVQFKSLLEKYKEIEQRLSRRDDEVAKHSHELLTEGKLEEAEAILKNSFNSRLENIEKQQKLAAKEVFELGGIQELKLDYDEAQQFYQQAVKLDPDNSACLNSLGLVEMQLGQYQAAITYFEEALSINHESLGERHPRVADTLNNLGVSLRSLGEYKQAIDLDEQALSIRREFYGLRHPKVAASLNNLGLSWWGLLGEYKHAIKLYTQALSIKRDMYGEHHPSVTVTLNNLGLTWVSLVYRLRIIRSSESLGE